MITFLNNAFATRHRGKVCVLRIDLNVDMKSIEGQFRLRSVIPTILLLRAHKIRVVLVSHRGRPKGVDKSLSLKSFTSIIEKEIKEKVEFLPTFDFGLLRDTISSSDNNIFLLENIRFLKGEEENSELLGRQLASLGEIYVNDAFAVSHRAHASVHAITKHIRSVGGLQLQKEVVALTGAMKKMEHPYIFILGGAKVKDKLPLIAHFWKKADMFLMGGGPANTLLAAQGIPMHNSLYDASLVKEVRAYAFSAQVITPTDVTCEKMNIVDIGEETGEEYAEIIRSARMIVWNGPMGWHEKKKYSQGTARVWKAALSNKKATIVIGGGETIASLSTVGREIKKVPKNIFLSTGGGAMLSFLSGEKLPGLVALQ